MPARLAGTRSMLCAWGEGDMSVGEMISVNTACNLLNAMPIATGCSPTASPPARQAVNDTLNAAYLHVWSVPLDLTSRQHAYASALLSPDELERAAGGRFERIRLRSIARRAWLRLILSRYVQIAPEGLDFRYGAYGKPRLAGASTVHFNASSAREWGVIAVSNVLVGVDVETDIGAPSAHVGPEVAKSSPTSVKSWTCHEAFAKAVGCGLSSSALTFDIEWHAGAPFLMRTSNDDPRQWTLMCMRRHQDLVVTVAARAKTISLCEWTAGRDLDRAPTLIGSR
jgi:4'-phosphopantetheinyl transferase